ncbi:methylated-DNA--[protein]-cysteine S-methyltransferase [Falsirhodobacter halotolerans]|uniref:methylated-DNA--[protein]-cysteine S-methyltransferase n=1 Tax=Falsirhodobacter halotolerans TaxID=1146892 RepID=UPI001FD190A8|nr:methylated-DNA--[protein]-cysteine S-methyltransferase [Falsirhodobacter halotolerans]MCJ8141170.1 methylated-DNA--[protein]-cysteine S-methyltransferase [Falsirhodobacter halotolerans]
MQWRTWMDSPVGRLQLIATDDGVSAVLWEGEDGSRIGQGPVQDRDDHPVLEETARQLNEYFAGTRQSFDLPMDARGTPFQHEVWAALRAIPYGETRSYGDIARSLGRPKAFRAVGAANGRNPLSIVSPCHRVIATGGGLGGFAGGLAVKSRLLDMERSDRP